MFKPKTKIVYDKFQNYKAEDVLIQHNDKICLHLVLSHLFCRITWYIR